MISLSPSGSTKKDYLQSRGIPVEAEEAFRELSGIKPLIPVCLMVFGFYSQATVCCNKIDFETIRLMECTKTWYLMDLEEICNDFPEYARTINQQRKLK